jgi:hypothetical protein
MGKSDSGQFVPWALGLLSPLCVAGVLGLFNLAHTVTEHQVKIALLWGQCPACRRALAEMPARERTPSIWAALGLLTPDTLSAPAAKKDRHEKNR